MKNQNFNTKYKRNERSALHIQFDSDSVVIPIVIRNSLHFENQNALAHI